MRLRMVQGILVSGILLFGFRLSVVAADTYKIDPEHTSITFSVSHMGINHVKGQFKDYAGIVILDNGAIKDANGIIQIKSIDTGVQKRDDHLRTADFFDAAKYPTITFRTKRVERAGDQPILVADFTMRGVTNELRLPVKLSGPAQDPWGNIRIGLQAASKLRRKDYGINFHQVLESGALMVGEEVELQINAEAIKQKEG